MGYQFGSVYMYEDKPRMVLGSIIPKVNTVAIVGEEAAIGQTSRM